MVPEFLISVLIVLIVVGLLLWILSLIPMDATIKQIVHVVVIVCVALWLISVLLGYAPPVVMRH